MRTVRTIVAAVALCLAASSACRAEGSAATFLRLDSAQVFEADWSRRRGDRRVRVRHVIPILLLDSGGRDGCCRLRYAVCVQRRLPVCTAF